MTDSPATRRLCVYTTLIGRYEELTEQPMAVGSTMPFICLTDDADLKSDSWEVRRVSRTFEADPVRSQRDLKLRPHLYLPDFDGSLYIDNSVLLTAPAERIIEKYDPPSGIWIPRHGARASLLDEFLQVVRLGRDDQNRVFEQLNHYLLSCPDVLKEKPYWAAIIIRDHRNAKLQAVLELWLAHVLRYSRRDQLSANYVFRKADLSPDVVEIDRYSSWFHNWPVAEGRHADQGTRSAAFSAAPPLARLRELEQEVERLEAENRKLRNRPPERIRRAFSTLFRMLRQKPD